jgi:hypothetical protein
MLKKRTTLILGAGASMDFEFPSGRDLRRKVLKMLAVPDSAGSLALQELGFERSDRNEFAHALQRSNASSVDAFLGTRDGFVKIGKAAIAAALIPFEDPEKVFPLDKPQNWLELLTMRMAGATLKDWTRNALAIVTFNYDRVMEFVLHSSVMHAYGLSADEAGALLSKVVRIVHVHGQLGGYPDVKQYEDLPTGLPREFSPELTGEAVRVAASGLRVLHEGGPGDATFAKARELIAWAEEVLILGFGYHRQSMDRLELSQTLPGKTCVGSCVGMEDSEWKNVHARLGGSSVMRFADDCADLALLLRRNHLLGHR